MSLEQRGFVPAGPEKKKAIEDSPEIPEFAYEAGRDDVVERLDGLLEEQDVVVVAFASTGQNVGKSTLARELLDGYFKRGINAIMNHDADELEERWESKRDMEKPPGYAGKTLLIFDQQDMSRSVFEPEARAALRSREDATLKATLGRIGFQSEGVDLWVGVSRPDMPFPKREGRAPIVDMIIVNERAKDK